MRVGGGDGIAERLRPPQIAQGSGETAEEIAPEDLKSTRKWSDGEKPPNERAAYFSAHRLTRACVSVSASARRSAINSSERRRPKKVGVSALTAEVSRVRGKY